MVTGLVGAAGGIGAFLLPIMLGALRQAVGTYSVGFILFGVGAICALAATVSIRIAWSRDPERAEAWV